MATLRAGALLARRYRLIDPIGAGGMSIIWRARDELLDRMVAIKVLASELAADARFRALVREEARAAAQLVHPHVTAVHDYGEFADPEGSITAFVVMELLSGEELESRLTAGPLPWRQAIEVCAQVAEALAAAHRLGIVHRDVTPANIMLTDNGAKVLDFGIATHIGAPDEDEDGDTFGTPAYVAPERLDGVPAQPATDTYSLGVLLFETLSGRVPFPAETWDDLARARPGGPMPPLVVPGLPDSVVDICRRCLSRDPLQRPTARQVGGSLREQLRPAEQHAPATMFAPTLSLPLALPRVHIDANPVALATAPGATATLVGGTPDILAPQTQYEIGVAPRPGVTAVPGSGSGPPPGGNGWSGERNGGSAGTGRCTEPGHCTDPGHATDPGPPTVPGAGGPPTPPGMATPRHGWSPIRAGLAAVGSIAALAAAMLIGVNLGDAKNPPAVPQQNAPQAARTPEAAGTASPAPTRSTDASAPGTTANPIRPTPTRLTVRQAVDALGDVIDDGLADGDIGRDAGMDLQQMVFNLRLDLAADSADVDAMVTLLRQKVSTRANEGAIKPRSVSRLMAALDRLADAR